MVKNSLERNRDELLALSNPSLYTRYMAITHEGPAPYAPVAHVLGAIEHYREKAPPVITKELLMRTGLADAYANRTLRALRLLDLVDDEGNPTDAFKRLRQASSDEFTSQLEQVIRTAYQDVFQVVDPAKDSEVKIDNAFRFYDPAAQRERMVVLFMGLCEAAGIIPTEKAPRRRSTRSEIGKKASSGSGGGNGRTQTRPAASEPAAPYRDPDPDSPPAKSSIDSLRTRYIDMLLSKAEAKDEVDDKLLDRIEALLREDEQKD